MYNEIILLLIGNSCPLYINVCVSNVKNLLRKIEWHYSEI